MAEMITIRGQTISDRQWAQSIQVLSWAWETTGVTSAVSGGSFGPVTGRIWGFKAMPSAAKIPDNDYDIEILDETNGMDILNGAGLDLPNTAASAANIRCPGDYKSGKDIPLVSERLRFRGTGLGTSAAGVFNLFVETP